MSLKTDIIYIEAIAKAEVENVYMYHRRRIFETTDGEYWVIDRVVTAHNLVSLEDATEVIEKHPEQYPPVPSRVR